MFDSITGVLSGGWFDPKSPDYSALGVNNERQRQGRIDAGMQLINAIYGGGSSPVYSLATSATPGTQYWRQNGAGKFIMTRPYSGSRSGYPGGSPGRSNNPADYAALAGSVAVPGLNAYRDFFGGGLFSDNSGPAHSPELSTGEAEQAIKMGRFFTKEDKTFEGFQPKFFDDRAQAYVDYAMPQLAQQYKNTRDATTYNLANRGLSKSSISDQEYSSVDRQLATSKQGVVDTARGQAMDLLRQVEASRQKAIDQLYKTGSPSEAANSAISDYYNLQQPSIFAPLANSFANIVRDYQTGRILNDYRGANYLSPYDSTDASSGVLPNPTYGST